MEETLEQFVVDASFVLKYLLPDEKNPKEDMVFEMYAQRKIDLISTNLLPFEVLNSLKSAKKSKRIAENEMKSLAKSFLKLKISLKEVDFLIVLKIALEKNLSVYDASYLYLAKFMKTKLLTLDESLKKLNQTQLFIF